MMTETKRGYSIETRSPSPVVEIGQIHFKGNITPQSWYHNLRLDSGKPYLVAITLLADIVYWYRPIEIRDEVTGEVTELRKKFAADKLQRSYQAFADQFGLSKRQVSDALHWLEQRGIISLELRTIQVNGMPMSNALFIEPNAAAIASITFWRDTSHARTLPLSLSGVGGITPESETYTETTTETTTETIITCSAAKSAAESTPADLLNPRQPPKAKQKRPIPPAVNIFRENAHRFPPKAWWSEVIQTVGEQIADLERWGQVVKCYVGLGWNPGNVRGMLDFFKRNEIPPDGKARNNPNGNGTQKPKRHTSSPTPEQIAEDRRLLAERDRKRALKQEISMPKEECGKTN